MDDLDGFESLGLAQKNKAGRKGEPVGRTFRRDTLMGHPSVRVADIKTETIMSRSKHIKVLSGYQGRAMNLNEHRGSQLLEDVSYPRYGYSLVEDTRTVLSPPRGFQ